MRLGPAHRERSTAVRLLSNCAWLRVKRDEPPVPYLLVPHPTLIRLWSDLGDGYFSVPAEAAYRLVLGGS